MSPDRFIPLIEQETRNIELLTEKVDTLADAFEHVADALSQRPTKRETLGIVGTMALITALFVVLFFIPTFLVLKSNNKNSSLLVECTTPSVTHADGSVDVHECYADGQRRTGEAVASIVNAVIFTNECARQFAVDAEIEACVRTKLAGVPVVTVPSASATTSVPARSTATTRRRTIATRRSSSSPTTRGSPSPSTTSPSSPPPSTSPTTAPLTCRLLPCP